MNPEKFSKDFACNHHEHLPCEFAHIDGDVHRCSYHRLWVLASWVNGDEQLANNLLKKACPPIKKEEAFTEYLIRMNNQNALDIIENTQIGDDVFCVLELFDEAILVEKPKINMGHALYKTMSGEIRSCQVGHLIRISKGNFMAEYFAKSEGKRIREYSDSELRCLGIKRMALQAGFRVEIQETKNDAGSGHLIKVFGDNQREVDDFMTLCVYNSLILY